LCLGTGQTCERKSWCGVHPVWQKAQMALTGVLSGVTVAQLAADTKARKAQMEMATGRL